MREISAAIFTVRHIYGFTRWVVRLETEEERLVTAVRKV